MAEGSGSPLVISYLTLRKAIGYLGIALPFAVAIGAKLLHGIGMQSSVSGYYHTPMRDVFVGILCSIGVFLMAYKGYEKIDARIGKFAGLFGIGVALFATAPDNATPHEKLIGMVHIACASLFFLLLAYFSLKLFRKTDPNKPPTPQKLNRNKVYRVCGYTMLGALACILLVGLLPEGISAAIKRFHPTFWFEAIAIEAFGISWMTKGEAILKDEA